MANVFIDENTLIAIADAIRAKTGNTDKILPKDMSVAIDGITTGGGGSSNDVRYVTFMNGNTVLYVKPVAVGDDCVNVLTKGFIETPTKESTVDTVYTYSGWSLTDGGSTDTTNALANVTQDRTVYASYTESVRYYTVNFYDGETLLKTEQIPYGGSSTYTYAKDNYLFTGWTPEPTNITGNLDCYGVWEESYSFADASWEYINQISESGKASEVFALGDTRTETINGVDATIQIIGFNHDEKSDGTGNAGITVWVRNSNNLFSGTYIRNTSESALYTEQPFYTAMVTLLDSFDVQLKSVIKEVNKRHTSGSDMYQLKIWSPSERELTNGGYNYSDKLYNYFITNSAVDKAKRTLGFDYWLRTSGTRYMPQYINEKGSIIQANYASTNYSAYPMICFCV